MDIREFCLRHGREPRGIRAVMADWQLSELRTLLSTATEKAPEQTDVATGVARAMNKSVGDAVILGDFLRGNTLLDQIPPELRNAFTELMKVDRRDFGKMRSLLIEHFQTDDGGFLPFDDPRVMGFVSKIKGQIGENLFKQHVGEAASLATSGSQEGWDVAVRQANGTHEYVQVKLYKSPTAVVQHMRKVQQKVLDGTLDGVDQDQVQQVYFAVPEDIHDEVRRLAERYDGLADMVYDKTIPISALDAANLVTEGLENVGPDQLAHFFGELLSGSVVAGSLHGVVNGFLWYKGSKVFSAAVADAAADSAVSSLGIGVALLAETVFDTALMAGGAGMAARMILKRAAWSRWDFADFLKESLASTRSRFVALQIG